MTFYLDEFLFWRRWLCPFLRIGTGWSDYKITRLLGSRTVAGHKQIQCVTIVTNYITSFMYHISTARTTVDKDILILVNSKSGYNLTLHSYRIK